MELIHLELTDAQLRQRSVPLTAEVLGREPQSGVRVVVHDTWADDYYAGVVALGEGGCYDLRLSMRMPESMAQDRITGLPEVAPEPVQRVADVGAELRASLHAR